MMCQDVTMFITFPIKFKLFQSKIPCYIKFPSVPAPNAVRRLSRWHLTHTHSYLSLLHSREIKDLQDNCVSWEDCEELNCETVIHYMPEPKIILRFAATSPQEERAPDSPASDGMLSNRVSISNWGLQTHCWVGFFPLPPPLAMADSGCGKWEECVHSAQSAASIPGQAQPEKQCQDKSCQAGSSAELLPCHNWMGQGSWPSKGHGLSFSSPKSWQKTQGSKTKTRRLSLSRRQAETKIQHRFRFYPLLSERNSSPQPSSFTSSPWAASCSWCLGTGLHSAL